MQESLFFEAARHPADVGSLQCRHNFRGRSAG